MKTMEQIEVTQADIELRKAILKCIVDGLDRACTDGDMIEDRTDNLDRIIAAHRIFATRTDATPVATDVAALVDHFRRMIEACANYVEPTTYIARHPIGEQCKWDTELPEPDKHQSIDAALARTHRRDKAFIMDMIYMLDGPEQRAALAPFTKDQLHD